MTTEAPSKVIYEGRIYLCRSDVEKACQQFVNRSAKYRKLIGDPKKTEGTCVNGMASYHVTYDPK